jgi:hypothetical protein
MHPGQDDVQLTATPTPTTNMTLPQRPSGGETAHSRLGDGVRTRFRIAHVALVTQGLAIGVLGGVSLAWSMANLRFGTEGIPIFFLLVTPAHGGLLLTGGALAVLACLGRWTTVGFSVIAAASWATLTVVCAIECSRHIPGALGFDAHDTLLYAALAVYNLAVCLLLAPALRERAA